MPVLGILEGEGVGPEVVTAALKVLDAVESVTPLRVVRRFGGDIGLKACAEGELTGDITDFCRKIFHEGGALFCGPGGGRFVYDLRREFNLYCKIAPIQPCPPLCSATRFRQDVVKPVDMLVVRDNAGGVYQGKWSERTCQVEGAIAEHHFSYTGSQVQQIVEAGVRLAKTRRGRVDVVIKEGGVPAISSLWRRIAETVTQKAGVRCGFLNADYAAYQMIQHPETFDVLVTPNFIGDVLADLGAVFLGSRGMSYSGNFSPTGLAAYQTGHGAAHDLAGTDIANPVAQILSLAMTLRESFGLIGEAILIERAIEHVIRSGKRTKDIAEPGCKVIGTREMGESIAQAVITLASIPEPK